MTQMLRLIRQRPAMAAHQAARAAALGYIVFAVPGWERLGWLAGLLAADLLVFFTVRSVRP